MHGQSGDSLTSISFSHLLEDSISPEIPVVISGECDTAGVVTIKWVANEEEDLRGYRLFKTYRTDLDPDRVFVNDTLAIEITDTIDLKMPYNSIFYRIYALDHHFNASLPTAYIEVKIPDNKPPTNGFIKDYSVGIKGITIEWQKSVAYDLKKMYLLRKADTDFEFKPLLVLQGDSLKVESFTDTTTKSSVRYEYAVQSEDESGNLSELSETMNIQQYDKRIINPVTNLKGIASRENRMVKLSWTYPEEAVGFRIYRSRNEEPLQTHKYVKGTEREYYDKELKPNSEYTYLLVAELKKGKKSGYSKKVIVKY